MAGTGFSAGVVAAMLDVPVLSLLGPLDEGRAAGFLLPGARPGDHRFSHALVRSAVAAGLSAAEQRRLHAAAAGVAADELAFEEAVRLYRQALSVGEGEIDEAERSRLELALAAVLYRSGDLAGSQQTAARVGRRAERRRDRLWLARTALVMEASGALDWDGEICRLCEQALAGDELPDDLRARVSARYAQALVYQGEYDRAGQVSRDALAAAGAAAGSAAGSVALVDALRARQLACCAPDGVTERAGLARRMLRAADAVGSAWVEMWGRLWHIDTLFETGQLRSVPRELADLGPCLERLRGPVGEWHFLLASATLALATRPGPRPPRRWPGRPAHGIPPPGCACPAGRTRCRSPSAWAGRRTSSSWRSGSSRSAVSTSRTAPAPGSTWARSSWRSGWRPPPWAAWTRP